VRSKITSHHVINHTACGAIAEINNLKPNSITLAGSKPVRSWSPTSFELVCDQLRTSFEPASVMEFGFYGRTYCHHPRNTLASPHMGHRDMCPWTYNNLFFWVNF